MWSQNVTTSVGDRIQAKINVRISAGTRMDDQFAAEVLTGASAVAVVAESAAVPRVAASVAFASAADVLVPSAEVFAAAAAAVSGRRMIVVLPVRQRSGSWLRTRDIALYNSGSS